MKNTPFRTHGHSLLELLVTLALLSAMGAMAAPSFAEWHTRRVVFAESERVRRALERAYLMALSFDTPVAVTLVDTAVKGAFLNGSEIFSYTPRHDVTVKIKSSEQKSLTFYPTHTTTPSTLLISNAAHLCSVVVSLRGRVRSSCI